MQEKAGEVGVAHYKFEYKEGTGAWQLGTEGNDTGTTKTVTFNVPKDNTTYTLRVTVTDGAGNVGTSTGSYSIKTQVANTPPYNLTSTVSSTGTNSLTIQARAYDTEDGSANRNLSYTLSLNGQTKTALGKSGSYVTFGAVTGLSQYTTYSWTVTVTDTNGASISNAHARYDIL